MAVGVLHNLRWVRRPRKLLPALALYLPLTYCGVGSGAVYAGPVYELNEQTMMQVGLIIFGFQNLLLHILASWRVPLTTLLTPLWFLSGWITLAIILHRAEKEALRILV